MTLTHLPSSGLVDRQREREVLDGLIHAVLEGRSRVLVLRGDAGIGKTALLGHLSAAAEGCRIVRAAGVQSEMELAFAGLHALCMPLLGRVGQLPGPQRDALSTAFGLSAGPPPDRFLVGLAVLSLLANAGEERPLVCVVDDAQWLDRVSAQTLAFVGRRLFAEPVGLVFALREFEDQHELDGLSELAIQGLPAADARVLLDATIPGPLDGRVRARILAEAGGNPLALLELPRGLTPATVAGGFGLPGEQPLTGRIEQRFVQQLEPLPIETRRLVLLAAAEPVGDVPLLWRAAEVLGIGPDVAGPAEAAGLVEIGTRVRFRHPLVRSAAYRAATVPDRRRAHEALAQATDPKLDPDRRAWHLAAGASGPDEDVATELERSAGRAQARGGLAAAAAFRQRALALTEDPTRRTDRVLAAAEATLRAGVFEPAAALLATAEPGALDELARARIELLHAEIAFAQRRSSEAPPLLLAAARRLEQLDVRLARETYLEAVSALIYAGHLASNPAPQEVGEAARRAPASPRQRPSDLLLDALAVRFADGYAAAAPIGERAVQAFIDDDEISRHEIALARGRIDPGRGSVGRRELARAPYPPRGDRPRGRRADGPPAGARLAYLCACPRGGVEGGGVACRGGTNGKCGDRKHAAALRGAHIGSRARSRARGPRSHRRHDQRLRAARSRARRHVLTLGERSALQRARALRERADRGPGGSSAPPEGACLPALELGRADRGGRTKRRESSWRPRRLTGSRRRPAPLAPTGRSGLEARSRALLSEGDAAEQLYREAIERLDRTRIRLDLARARLLYGEWLRRENRRVDAREQLRAAHDMFSLMGAEAFADRARRELLATGATVRRLTSETRDNLTPQETQIARLAADGKTNPEIGAQLFISPRTVEYHLHKVFIKLDVGSRKELRRAVTPFVSS